MKHVEQQDRSGCGLACVAMVTGETYAHVRAEWLNGLLGDEGKLLAVGSGAGLNVGELVMLLNHFGVTEMLVDRKHYGNGEWWTIIDSPTEQWRICEVPTDYGCGHWIVKADGKTYDPAEA